MPASSFADVRERLLDVAGRLFYERGVRAVGVDTIATESGVAKMSLYNHFGSKDELIAAWIRHEDERSRAWLTQRLTQRSDTPAGQALAVFDVYAGVVESEGYRGCPFLDVAAELADAEHPAHVAAREHKQWLRDLLARLAREAGARDAERLGAQLALLVDGALSGGFLHASTRPALDARAAAEALLVAAGADVDAGPGQAAAGPKG